MRVRLLRLANVAIVVAAVVGLGWLAYDRLLMVRPDVAYYAPVTTQVTASQRSVVKRVAVRAGDVVTQGAVLVEVDGDDLGHQIDAVEGEIAAHVASLAALDARTATAKKLAALTVEPAKEASARLTADVKVLRASLARIDRRIKAVESAPQDVKAPLPPSDLDELLSERTGLAQRLQEALNAQAQAEAALAGASGDGGASEVGAESAELADLALRRAQIEASAERARAQLAALHERAATLKVTSPCDCVVSWIGALVGQPVDAGTPLLTLRDAAQGAGEFEALVDARSAAALRVGAAAWVDVEDGRVLPARVDQVLAAGNADPRAAATAGWASKGYALVRLAAPHGVDLAALAAGAPVGVKISRVSRASGAGSALQTVSAAGEARAAEAH